MFYEDSIPVGISILTIDEQGTPVEASPYKDMTVKPTVVVPLSAEECFLKIEKCLNKYPGFEIMGIVGDTNGYPNMYPVGKQSGKETIQYMSNEPMDFKLVEPFETLEEGQAAFTAYHIEKQRILSEITLYPWVDATCYYGGYLSKFENSAEYITAQKTGAFTYLEDYDSVIAVPLLSEDLQENEYILHLLYYHNQLIAELVLQRTEDGETVVPVWENVADKTPDGTYIPIETAAYVRVLEQEAEKNTAWENQGVVFSEGQFCPIGLSEGSLMIYKTNTSITETAHADAPRILSLGSVQAYNDLIAASSLNETKLQEFLSVNNYIMNGIRTKEDILVLKKVMDSVPFPVFENAELTVFEINMDYPSMFIRYRMESQNTVRFRISLNAQSAEEKMAAAIRSADTSVELLSTDTMQSLYYTGTSERTTTTALTYIAIVNGHYVTIEVFDTSRENADRYVRSVNFNSLD